MVISLGTIVSSLISEKVIRRFGTGLVTAVSVAMTAVALLGFSVSNSFWMLILWAIPFGLGAGGVDVAAAMAGRSYYIQMPDVIEVRLTGKLRAGVSAKDIILYVRNALAHNDKENPLLIKSCIFHYEFVFIHPFSDGNGRMARLMMNYVLISSGYLPLSIPLKYREQYFNSLEEFKVNNNKQHC